MNDFSAYMNDPRVRQFLSSLQAQDLGGQNQFAQMVQPQQMPQNYIKNESTGKLIDLGPSMPRAGQSGIQLDFSTPAVDVAGVGKGYRAKNDPFGIYDVTGRKLADLGNDTEATRKRQLEDVNLQGKLIDNADKMQELRSKLGNQLTGRPEGLKLKPGEFWNPQTQAVESVPGSELYTQQSGRHAKDLDTLNTAKATTKLAIDKIDEITKGNEGENYTQAFQSNFGGYNAYLSQYLPGEATDVRKKIESLKSNLKTAGLQMMRQGGSIGQMTEREWPIVEQAIASISPALSENEAAFQLAKVKTYMENLAKRAQQTYETEWGNTQFGRMPNQTPPMDDADKQALDWANANPTDPRAAKIKQKLGM